MEENLCNWCNWQGFNIQNIGRTHITQCPRKSIILIKNGTRPQQTFFQDIQMAKGTWKMFNIADFREMQVKTTMRYHLTLARTAIIKSLITGEVVKKREPCTLLLERYIYVATRENSVEVPWKTKNRVTIGSSNPTPGMYLEKMKILFKTTHTP